MGIEQTYIFAISVFMIPKAPFRTPDWVVAGPGVRWASHWIECRRHAWWRPAGVL